MSKADQPDHNRAGSESIETSVADLQLPETVLVTGFPGFIARRLVAKILASDTIARVYLVCQPGPAEQGQRLAALVAHRPVREEQGGQVAAVIHVEVGQQHGVDRVGWHTGVREPA